MTTYDKTANVNKRSVLRGARRVQARMASFSSLSQIKLAMLPALLCAALISPMTQADDIDVFFPDKRATFNPNILLSMDTSQSMMNRDIPNKDLGEFDARFPYGGVDTLYDSPAAGGDRHDHRFNVNNDIAFDPDHYYIQAPGQIDGVPNYFRIGGIRNDQGKYVNRFSMVNSCAASKHDLGRNKGAKGYFEAKWTFRSPWNDNVGGLSTYATDWNVIKRITKFGCDQQVHANESAPQSMTVYTGGYLAYKYRKFISRAEAQGLGIFHVVNDLEKVQAPVNIGLAAFAEALGTIDARGRRPVGGGLTNRDGGFIAAPVKQVTPEHADALRKVIAEKQTLGEFNVRWNYLPYSPVGETMFEALMYFTGDFAFFGGEYTSNNPEIQSPAANGNTSYNFTSDLVANSQLYGRYESPIIDECQRNAVIVLTDGGTLKDDNHQRIILGKLNRARAFASTLGASLPQLPTNGAQTDNRKCQVFNNSGEGRPNVASCLVPIAETMGNAKLQVNEYKSDKPANKKYIVTNDPMTIHGVNLQGTSNADTSDPEAGALFVLKQAVEKANGDLYNAQNTNEFSEAIQALIETINSPPTTFVAPTVTPNLDNALADGDELFFPLFNAASFNRWESNVRKYKIDYADGGKIKDKNNRPVLDDKFNFIVEDENGNVPQDLWAADQTPVPAHEVMGNQGAASQLRTGRDLYVSYGSGRIQALSESALKNTLLSPVTYPDQVLPAGLTAEEAEKAAKWTFGYDVNDDDGDGSTEDSNEYIGDPLHSSPKLLRYENGRDFVAFGTNQGFLHFVRANTEGRISGGREQWAFIPSELLNNTLTYYRNRAFGLDNKTYGLDGKMTLWHVDDNGDGKIGSRETAILYFGMRRGGKNVFALDVSDQKNPKALWDLLGENPAVGSQLGQSWGQPILGKVAWDYNGNNQQDDYALFISGGYDDTDDNNGQIVADTAWSTRGGDVLMLDPMTGKLLWSANRDTAMSQTRVPTIVDTPSVLDMNSDGLVDKIFALSIDGTLWRIDVEDAFDKTNDAKSFAKAYVRAKVTTEPATPRQSQRFMNPLNISLYTDVIDGLKKLHIAYGSGRRPDPLYGASITEGGEDIFVVVKDSKPFSPLDPNSTDDMRPTVVGDLQKLDTFNRGFVPDPSLLVNGWYMPLSRAEKVLNPSVTRLGTVVFTTFIPNDRSTSLSQEDGCLDETGRNKLYMVNIRSGENQFDDGSYNLKQPGIAPPFTLLRPSGGGCVGSVGLESTPGVKQCDPNPDPECDEATEDCDTDEKGKKPNPNLEDILFWLEE